MTDIFILRDVLARIQEQVNAGIALLNEIEVDGLEDAPFILPIDYISQWDSGATRFRSDCGPACVKVLCEYYSDQRHSVDDIMSWITGGVNRYTSYSELIRAADHFYGVYLARRYMASWSFEDAWSWLKDQIANDDPVLVLGHYGNNVMRIDRGFTSGHFFVVTGFSEALHKGETAEYVHLVDPDWWGSYTSQGANLVMCKPMFKDVWNNCHLDGGNPNQSALVV